MNENTQEQQETQEDTAPMSDVSAEGQTNAEDTAHDTVQTAEEGKEDIYTYVCIPYINGREGEIHPFQECTFRGTEDRDPVAVASDYFAECRLNDDTPKWDGVFYCKYDVEKDSVVKSSENRMITSRTFLAHQLWNEPGAGDNVTFTVKCTMPKAWASHFQSFLRQMESNGKTGHSSTLAFHADGKGGFRPTFGFTKEFTKIGGIPGELLPVKTEYVFDAD